MKINCAVYDVILFHCIVIKYGQYKQVCIVL